MIGEEATKRIKESKPGVFLEVCREFEKSKSILQPKSNIKFTVIIPCSIGKVYKNTSRKKIEVNRNCFVSECLTNSHLIYK